MLLDRLDQRETFALPMAGALDDNLVRRAGLFNLKTGVSGRNRRAEPRDGLVGVAPYFIS